MTRNREIFLTFIVMLVGLACAGSLVRTWGMSGSEAASWAQAVGTVLAIFATIAMTHRQIESVRLGRARDRQDLADGVAVAVQLAVHSFARYGPSIERHDREGFLSAFIDRDQTLRKPLDAFMEMSVGEWPSALLFVRAAAVQAEQNSLRDFANFFLTNAGAMDWPVLVRQLRVYEKAVADFRNAYEGLSF